MNDLLSLAEVSLLIGLGIDTIRKRMSRGEFPKPTHQRGRRRFWTREVVEAAIADLTKPINE